MKDLTEPEYLKILRLLRKQETASAKKLAKRVEEHLNLDDAFSVAGWKVSLEETDKEIVLIVQKKDTVFTFSKSGFYQE